jgi:hypothetical protein
MGRFESRTVDRRDEYFVRSGESRAADMDEFKRRYLNGLFVIGRALAPKHKKAGVVVDMKRKIS